MLECGYLALGRSGQRRKVHPDPDCRHLDQARGVREATESELEAFQVCGTCSGVYVPQGSGEGHLESLKAAASQGGEQA